MFEEELSMGLLSAVRSGLALIFMAIMLSACGGQAGTPAASASATPSPTPTPTPTPTPSASAAPVVLAQNVGTMGTILVAASNNHTLYTFDSDSPGVSRCSGSCSAIWPALTVAAGQAPTGGAGVTGQLGTITRSDGSLQVTYKGLPLYLFHQDASPGDTKGNYTGWSLVRP
jgi:predicted lipoprotein with Yx(FWY)xxD motif